MIDSIPIGSDVSLVASKARWTQDGTPIGDLVITYTLYDSDDDPVSGAEDVSMTLETDSGDYIGALAAAVTSTLTHMGQYRVEMTGTSSGKTRIKSKILTAMNP